MSTIPNSNSDSLHFIQRDFVTRAVVKLGGARGFMGSDGLGVFQRAAVEQEGCDAGGAKGVIADVRGQAGGAG